MSFGPHIALEKWRVEKEHKNSKKNFCWFGLLFLNLGFCPLVSVLSVYPWPWNAHYRQVLKGQLVDKSASLLMGWKRTELKQMPVSSVVTFSLLRAGKFFENLTSCHTGLWQQLPSLSTVALAASGVCISVLCFPLLLTPVGLSKHGVSKEKVSWVCCNFTSSVVQGMVSV